MNTIVDAIRSVFADVEVRRGAKAPETVRTKWDRALLLAEAKAKPHQFRKCSACGSGPWHRSWMSWDGVSPPHGEGKQWIGPCCSGAD